MEIKDAGHSYIIEGIDGYKKEINFLKKSNECREHENEHSGILTQELIRVAIDRLKYLNDIRFDPETSNAIFNLRESLYQLEARAYLRKTQGVNGKNEDHDLDARIPFDINDVEDLSIGSDGHVIPTIPEIKDEVEYSHDGKAFPSGPAFFIDPETRITVYTKESGWEEGVMIKDINWNSTKFYKKFYTLDDSIEELGLF